MFNFSLNLSGYDKVTDPRGATMGRCIFKIPLLQKIQILKLSKHWQFSFWAPVAMSLSQFAASDEQMYDITCGNVHNGNHWTFLPLFHDKTSN